MTYPILEFDASREAFIEPSKVNPRRDMPEHCVICFFKEVIEQVVQTHNARILVEKRSVFEIEYKGKRLAFYLSGIGAPLSGLLLEEVIAFGCKKFIVCGGAGVLQKDMAVGNLVIVSGAIRDEGVSYHYLPPDQEVIAHPEGVKALKNELDRHGVPYQVGKTWTTDAPYRETPDKIRKRKENGCITVEMECAGLMAIAQFREVVLGQVLYGGDDLSGSHWNNRGWQSRKDIRESLFWLCADACLAL